MGLLELKLVDHAAVIPQSPISRVHSFFSLSVNLITHSIHHLFSPTSLSPSNSPSIFFIMDRAQEFRKRILLLFQIYTLFLIIPTNNHLGCAFG